MGTSVISSHQQWQKEFRQKALRYHKIGCWVAIILNPLWGVSDYFVVPEHWKTFLMIRLAVAGLTGIGLLAQKRWRIGPEMLIMIPFLGIALQNAHMYSVMEVEMVRQHTFAYLALFLGAGMLILWEWWYSLIVVGITLGVNAVEFYLFSPLSTSEMLVNGGFLTATGALFAIVLIQVRYTLTKREIQARQALSESNQQLQQQKKVIENKNEAIESSIRYAQKIQKAILPADHELTEILDEYFVFYRPRDLVGGDFYWCSEPDVDQRGSLVAAVDCTGHGVPGGFMSMMGNELLNKIVLAYKKTAPAKILTTLDEEVRFALKQRNNKFHQPQDGMDMALCYINSVQQKLYFAGAKNPLYLVYNGEFQKFPGNANSIGGFLDKSKSFEQHEIAYQGGEMIYLFSDGYPDQFGGPHDRKFSYQRFRELLISIHDQPVAKQKKQLEKRFNKWKGDQMQIDDVLVMGVRL